MNEAAFKIANKRFSDQFCRNCLGCAAIITGVSISWRVFFIEYFWLFWAPTYVYNSDRYLPVMKRSACIQIKRQSWLIVRDMRPLKAIVKKGKPALANTSAAIEIFVANIFVYLFLKFCLGRCAVFIFQRQNSVNSGPEAFLFGRPWDIYCFSNTSGLYELQVWFSLFFNKLLNKNHTFQFYFNLWVWSFSLPANSIQLLKSVSSLLLTVQTVHVDPADFQW